jgi:hypothetical protein
VGRSDHGPFVGGQNRERREALRDRISVLRHRLPAVEDLQVVVPFQQDAPGWHVRAGAHLVILHVPELAPGTGRPVRIVEGPRDVSRSSRRRMAAQQFPEAGR